MNNEASVARNRIGKKGKGRRRETQQKRRRKYIDSAYDFDLLHAPKGEEGGKKEEEGERGAAVPCGTAPPPPIHLHFR